MPACVVDPTDVPIPAVLAMVAGKIPPTLAPTFTSHPTWRHISGGGWAAALSAKAGIDHQAHARRGQRAAPLARRGDTFLRMTQRDWNPRIFLIGGPPRTGKSSLARRLMTDCHIPFVSTDMLLHMLRSLDRAPAGDYSGSPRLPGNALLELAKSAIWTLDPPDYTIEGDDVDPHTVPGFRTIATTSACFLGNEHATAESLGDSGGWTAQLDARELDELAATIRTTSIELRSSCQRLGLPYVDISPGREAALHAAYDALGDTEG